MYKGAICAIVFLAVRTAAYGLNPTLDISQYAHTAWKIRDGFIKGPIISIAQTPDGYLWLGSVLGLFQFDGVHPTPWRPLHGEQLPSDYINSLLVTHDGTLWIGTLKGLASWKNGKLATYAELAGVAIFALLEDREGTLWVGAALPTGELWAIRGRRIECKAAGRFGQEVYALYEDHKGNLWVSAQNGLWLWKPGRAEHYPFPRNVIEANSLIEADSGALLLATNDGLKQLKGGKIQTYALPDVTMQFRANHLYCTRDGSMWVGSEQGGVLHLHGSRIDRFTTVDGLSGNYIGSIFEDREGDVWTGTTEGLDRFREFAVPTISAGQGLSQSTASSVQATQDGSIWIGTANGLNRWNNGHMAVYGSQRPQSLGIDDSGRLWMATRAGVFYLEGGGFARIRGLSGGNIFSIAADGHRHVWINNYSAGLFYWAPDSTVQQILWAEFRPRFGGRALLPDSDGLWIGFYEGGIVYLKDGEVQASYNAGNGLGHGIVSHLRQSPDGAVWVATEGGLSRVKDRTVKTLSSKNGLPCDAAHWSVEDDSRDVWLYTACGLVRIARSEIEAWVRDSKRPVQTTIFDGFDGVRSMEVLGSYGPHVTKSPDGTMWFASPDGVGVIDPRHLPFNKLPPPVHIEQVTADRKTYDAASGQHLPALTRDLQIEYTALSLVAPEKNRFQYKLEGYDNDWTDAGNRRQAFYTELPPRSYTFRVKASNNSGVWNEAGASLHFSVDPAYYQTAWFRALCAVGVVALLWALYRYRVHQIEREFNVRLEERMRERTRMARDLHDTLLQSFQGSLIEFQAARNLFAKRPDEAMHNLDDAIGSAEAAITEGRDAITDLRSGLEARSDLAQLLTAAGQELLEAQSLDGSGAEFDLTTEGPAQTLSPVLQDEIYRIGREILRNAFRHAQARRIEVEIRYDARMLRLRIRDDGMGIDSKVLAEGARAGHWGLPGVRERAKLIGARLDFWSEAGAGTEVQVAVPASIAYLKWRNGRGLGWLRKMKKV